MKQRKWTVEEKLAIVLEGLKEKRSLAEICREHKISQTLYYKWRDKFLESGKRGLINGSYDDNHYRAEIERLQKIMASRPYR
jgi:transposase-like protein